LRHLYGESPVHPWPVKWSSAAPRLPRKVRRSGRIRRMPHTAGSARGRTAVRRRFPANPYRLIATSALPFRVRTPAFRLGRLAPRAASLLLVLDHVPASVDVKIAAV